jgi:hypothetical protein
MSEVEKELQRLREVNDMQAAMINGMRRVVATARIINGQREDVRMSMALADYDRCKIITASGTGDGKQS